MCRKGQGRLLAEEQISDREEGDESGDLLIWEDEGEQAGGDEPGEAEEAEIKVKEPVIDELDEGVFNGLHFTPPG